MSMIKFKLIPTNFWATDNVKSNGWVV
jgi:hypothetical protein